VLTSACLATSFFFFFFLKKFLFLFFIYFFIYFKKKLSQSDWIFFFLSESDWKYLGELQVTDAIAVDIYMSILVWNQ